MAGFLLVRESASFQGAEAREAFSLDQGGIRTWQLGAWRLDARPHMVEDEPPWLEDSEGRLLLVAGCCVVAGLGRREGRDWLLQALNRGEDPSSRLRGAFVLLHWNGSRWQVMGDAGGVFPCFATREGGAVSTSFLALAAGLPDGPILDEDCLRHWLMLGFPLSPGTMALEISRLQSEQVLDSAGTCRFRRAESPPLPAGEPEDRAGRSDHAAWQLHVLGDWFADLAPHARECGVDVGISGGYDSRLLTLLLRRADIPFTLHTLVKERNNLDFRSAQALAQALGSPLTERDPTKGPRVRDDRQRTLDTWRLYDGRPAAMMDVSSPNYHPAYRAELLEDRRLAISGVGGEIYRNYNHSRPWGRGRLQNWVACHVFDPVRDGGIQDRHTADGVLDDLAQALATRLGLKDAGMADFDLARRYYSDVWLPDWHGQRNSAENRVAGYLSPFADRLLVEAAWRSRSHLGVGGAFEAEMLRQLDPAVAALPSSYGHGLDRLPPRAFGEAALRCALPDSWRLRLARWKRRPGSPAASAPPALADHMVPLEWSTYAAKATRLNLARGLEYSLGQIPYRNAPTTTQARPGVAEREQSTQESSHDR
jgi:hypothetical protein